jgi:hypothetical protein
MISINETQCTEQRTFGSSGNQANATISLAGLKDVERLERGVPVLKISSLKSSNLIDIPFVSRNDFKSPLFAMNTN